MKKATRILALVVALMMVLSLSAFASGEASGELASEEAAAEETAELTVESIEDMTASSYATLDAVNTRSQDEGYIYVGYDVVDGELTSESNWTTDDVSEITLANEVEGAGFTAVHSSGAASDVTVTGTLVLYNGEDDAEGVHASDFTGCGAAFVAADGGRITLQGVDLTTDGFVRAAVIVDDGAVAWIEDSSIVTYGANPLTEAYDGYVNSATTSVMLSPPWVLGIQGGIRTVNILDTEATFVTVNSYLASGGWGVVSTDGCTNPYLYFIDSTLEILSESEGGMDSGWELYGYDEDAYGSGYGSYVIGACYEYYYGATIEGATFGAIAREGTAIYASSNGTIDVVSPTGEELGTVEGQGNVTTINAVIGVITHSSEDVAISFTDGTVVNTEAAALEYRSSGHADIVFDEAVLNSKAGIIIQMIDDDDSTVGMGDMTTMGFNTTLVEDAGMPSQTGHETGATDSNEELSATFTNGDYVGNLYNGTGYYAQAGDVMNVTVGEGATLTGDIALTETFHGIAYSEEAVAFAEATDGVEYVFIDADFQVTEDESEAVYIQFTQFTINQYYMLCRMENHIYYNGYSAINVTVTDGGVWTVAEESLITYLNIDGGTVYGEIIENEDGSLTIVPSDEIIAEGEYGTAVEANVAESSGMGNVGGSSEPEGITVDSTADTSSSEEASEEVAEVETEASEEAEAEVAESDEEIPERPADLAEGEEPPGGFGGID
ncbi:MAG: hypothetical protein LUE22_01450 [Oscillospiraceae bacterium]|nr:hypothetical protein [Oscillospiraceae bacterium]